MKCKFLNLTLCVTLIVFLTHQSLYASGGRIPVRAKNGMVVSTSHFASQVGTEILQKGGNAVDAAVATAFALAVTWPSAGNIGGGGFLVYHGANGEITAFDFREKAPLAATQDMFLDENGKLKMGSNHNGLLSVGVPGTVAGMVLAHKRLGTLPWAELVKPAVKLAEQGIATTWALHDAMRRFQRERDKYPTTAKVFLKEDNSPYEAGEIWRQKDLAASLKRIQHNGHDGFYKGKTASLIADFMKENGGLITKDDLAKYQAVERQPIRGTYRGHDIISMCPPSSGGVAIVQMLNILEGYNLKATGHNSAAYAHLLIESMRRAFADRARFLGDPDFNPDIPIAKLTSKEYAKKLRQEINMFRASKGDPQKFNQAWESPETTHFSVMDKAGNAVSMTYTLEYSYGSRIVVPGAGFLLNNEMGDFNPVAGRTDSIGYIGTKPNLVAPQKRMLSSMTPTIVAKDGKPILIIGSPGGKTIINTTLQVILNVIDHGMNIGQAVEAGRLHHQWFPDKVSLESLAFSPDTQRLLENMGHSLRFRGSQGRAMGILLDQKTGIRYGAADSRSPDGRAIGY